MTTQNNNNLYDNDDAIIKEYAYLYDENHKPKILPEKYALSSAELMDNELYYNHTPYHCLCIVEEAKLPMTP
jgi:hypothetical protein